MRRLLLIRHGATSAVRATAFCNGDELEPAARGRAQALARSLPAGADAVAGPELACRQTAEGLGLVADTVPELGGCDVGDWRGTTLDEVQASDPAGLMAWLTDPESRPHGGESLTAFGARVAGWMTAAATGDGFLVAVVDAGVVKAAACHALAAPPSAFWRIDVSPLHVTELHARDGRWTIRHLNAELARGAGIGYGPPLTSS
jgi:broad specificity phosphatase PhoE